MATRDTAPTRRRVSALTIAALLTAGAAACADGGHAQTGPSAAAPRKAGGSAPREQLETNPLAELQGQDGLSLAITSAERDPAGYVTVRGDLTNSGAATAVVPAELRGSELKVLRTGPSLAGATLVDFVHRKRYYVLRDTEGRPLTTTGLSTLKSGQTARVFMQFPSPASDRVGFQLPLFDTATIKISQ